jgi:hypothetical protein
MFRKPTLMVFLLTAFMLVLYALSRHDLVGNCPSFFKEAPRAYATPAGADDIEDGTSFEGCTSADPVYIDMERWLLYAEIGGVLLLLLGVVDMMAFTLKRKSYARVGRRGERPLTPGVKVLLKISNFFGGF